MVADSAHSDALFRRRIRHLHTLGPRPIGEIIAEIMGRYPHARPFIEQRVERYAEINPAVLRWLRADDWLDDQNPIRLVSGGRS